MKGNRRRLSVTPMWVQAVYTRPALLITRGALAATPTPNPHPPLPHLVISGIKQACSACLILSSSSFFFLIALIALHRFEDYLPPSLPDRISRQKADMSTTMAPPERRSLRPRCGSWASPRNFSARNTKWLLGKPLLCHEGGIGVFDLDLADGLWAVVAHTLFAAARRAGNAPAAGRK